MIYVIRHNTSWYMLYIIIHHDTCYTSQYIILHVIVIIHHTAIWLYCTSTLCICWLYELKISLLNKIKIYYVYDAVWEYIFYRKNSYHHLLEISKDIILLISRIIDSRDLWKVSTFPILLKKINIIFRRHGPFWIQPSVKTNLTDKSNFPHSFIIDDEQVHVSNISKIAERFC